MKTPEHTEQGTRLWEELSILVVKDAGQVLGELQMLDLVLPYWHMCGSAQQ